VTADEASIAALAHHARQRSEDVDRRIEKAFKDLRRKDAAITVAAVAAQARVTRKTVYARPEILAASTPTPDGTSAPAAADVPSNTIVDALRRQIVTKDKEIAKLRATIKQQTDTIAILYGKLEHSPS
jgi:L-2-hydroxyglutarate oxidase LhgO